MIWALIWVASTASAEKKIEVWAAADAEIGTVVYLSDFTPLIFETNLRPPVPPIVFERDPRFVPLVRIVSLRTAVVFDPLDLVLVVDGEKEAKVSLNILPRAAADDHAVADPGRRGRPDGVAEHKLGLR